MITLTNGVQIPENAVRLQTAAAIDGYYVTQPLRLVQYDETLPVAAVQLTYQNQPYTPPTGAELNVRMGKPDGTTVYNPCLGMDSSGIVYFAFTQQMTIVAGTGTLTVEITDSGVKNSAPIIAEIRPNPVPEGSIESADEFLTLQEILAEAEKWGQIVQTNASNIQQVVDNLTDIQNAAENAQAAAESAAAAQQAAQEALGFRTFFAAVRPDKNGNLDPSRPMTVGPAASVEIESADDRIQSVTAFGFTQQAGTGDPSPTNVRALTNGGLKLVKYVFTGTENFSMDTYSAVVQFKCNLSAPASANPSENGGYSTNYKWKRGTSSDTVYTFSVDSSPIAYFRCPLNTIASAADFKSMLAARYAAGDPVIVWYQPADESQATGLYAPIILDSGEYRATCLPLTAPLCEGDSVVSWVRSGCDKVLVLTGTESWAAGALSEGAAQNYARYYIFGMSWVKFSEAYTSDYVYNKTVSAYTASLGVGVYGGENTFFDVVVSKADYPSVSEWKAHLAARYAAGTPVTIWYRSTNYTPAADIPVSLETHAQSVLVLDGTEGWQQYSTDPSVTNHKAYLLPVAGTVASQNSGKQVLCTIAPTKSASSAYVTDANAVFSFSNGNIGLQLPTETAGTVSALKSYLAAQYAAGTPVTIVYELATPITYAHEAVVLEAATGDQLTYTVTGQSGGTVSVALKPFQDGGDAKQLDGLTLAALQNLLVPVGYIFSWAPVDDGPDLSTPAKVAAYFGFGTWAAYGTGQVLVGVDSGQTEFATVGKTGGEKAHSLTTAEGPKHAHGLKWEREGGLGTGNGVLIKDANDGESYPYTYFTEFSGSGQAHNNLQPYVVVYRWQRIA